MNAAKPRAGPPGLPAVTVSRRPTVQHIGQPRNASSVMGMATTQIQGYDPDTSDAPRSAPRPTAPLSRCILMLELPKMSIRTPLRKQVIELVVLERDRRRHRHGHEAVARRQVLDLLSE